MKRYKVKAENVIKLKVYLTAKEKEKEKENIKKR